MATRAFHIEAMEARSVDAIPEGKEWQYEPKWDGFRCLLAKDGDKVTMYSKSGQDLARYFPEVAIAARKLREPSFVLDGELVVQVGRQFSFDDFLQRIHPAASRVKKLSAETPALFLAFDLLKKNIIWDRAVVQTTPATGGFCRSLLSERIVVPSFPGQPKVQGCATLACFGRRRQRRRNRQTDRPTISGREPGGMQKIKRYRTADVRFSSGIKAKEKPALTDKLEAVRQDRSFTGNAPGGPSRWSTKRSSKWQPVKPKFVVEVSYDHFTGGRFRHGASILKWRPDKKPAQCTLEQVKQKIAHKLISSIASAVQELEGVSTWR